MHAFLPQWYCPLACDLRSCTKRDVDLTALDHCLHSASAAVGGESDPADLPPVAGECDWTDKSNYALPVWRWAWHKRCHPVLVTYSYPCVVSVQKWILCETLFFKETRSLWYSTLHRYSSIACNREFQPETRRGDFPILQLALWGRTPCLWERSPNIRGTSRTSCMWNRSLTLPRYICTSITTLWRGIFGGSSSWSEIAGRRSCWGSLFFF